MDQYSYANGKFEPTTIDLEGDISITDWDRFLASLGWEAIGRYPTHQNSEFAYLTAYSYRRKDDSRHLVEVYLKDCGIVEIVCPTALDFLLLQRDFLTPLCRSDDADMLIDAVIEACHCLFDERDGLSCAQRVKTADRLRDEHYRQLREQREKKKSAGATPKETL